MKKKLLPFFAALMLFATSAFAATTHYNITLPTVGASANVWGTLLNSAFGSVDTQLWTNVGGVTLGLNATTTSGNVALTNPINSVQNLSFTTTGKSLSLPPMNATTSPVVGGNIYVNNVGSNPFEIFAADGSTAVVTSLPASQSVQLQALSNSTTNGSFQVLGPFLTTVGTTVLGTSSTGASPQISGDATTGFYTAGAGKVDVAISGTKIGEWSSTGLNGAAIGQTTSANAIFVTTTASISTVSTLTAGGNLYPTTAGTNTQFLQTNGAGTTSWASPTTVYSGGTAGTAIPQASTYYMWIGTGTTESNFYTFTPSGTFGNMRIKASAGLPFGQTATFTLDKNGSPTSITCTITGTSDTCNDTTHTVVAAGEVYDISVVTSATTGSLTYNFTLTQTIP